MSTCRLTIVCSELMICAATAMRRPLPGARAVALAAGDDDAEEIRSRHQRTWPCRDHAGIQVGADVQRKRRVRLRDLQQSLLQHQRRAAALALGHTFLGGLEHEQYRSGQAFA
jgi:hypothetical protein